jgi:hypothetical protein
MSTRMKQRDIDQCRQEHQESIPHQKPRSLPKRFERAARLKENPDKVAGVDMSGLFRRRTLHVRRRRWLPLLIRITHFMFLSS